MSSIINFDGLKKDKLALLDRNEFSESCPSKVDMVSIFSEFQLTYLFEFILVSLRFY